MGTNHSGPFKQGQPLSNYEIIQKLPEHNIIFLKHQTTNKDYLFREFAVNDKTQFQNMKEKLQNRIQLQCEFITKCQSKNFLYLSVGFQEKLEDHLCSAFYKLFVIWQYPNKTLADEYGERVGQNQKFQELQLFAIMASIFEGMNCFQTARVKYQALTMSNILFTPQGSLKIADPLTHTFPPNFQRISSNRKLKQIYISPEQCQSLKNQRPLPNFNPYKSDVFVLGLILLECALGEKIDSIYVDQFQDIDFEELTEKLNKLKRHYSNDLYVVLKEMLVRDPKERMDWLTLKKHMPQKKQGWGKNDSVNGQNSSMNGHYTNGKFGHGQYISEPYTSGQYTSGKYITEGKGHSNGQHISWNVQPKSYQEPVRLGGHNHEKNQSTQSKLLSSKLVQPIQSFHYQPSSTFQSSTYQPYQSNTLFSQKAIQPLTTFRPSYLDYNVNNNKNYAFQRPTNDDFNYRPTQNNYIIPQTISKLTQQKRQKNNGRSFSMNKYDLAADKNLQFKYNYAGNLQPDRFGSSNNGNGSGNTLIGNKLGSDKKQSTYIGNNYDTTTYQYNSSYQPLSSEPNNKYQANTYLSNYQQKLSHLFSSSNNFQSQSQTSFIPQTNQPASKTANPPQQNPHPTNNAAINNNRNSPFISNYVKDTKSITYDKGLYSSILEDKSKDHQYSQVNDSIKDQNKYGFFSSYSKINQTNGSAAKGYEGNTYIQQGENIGEKSQRKNYLMDSNQQRRSSQYASELYRPLSASKDVNFVSAYHNKDSSANKPTQNQTSQNTSQHHSPAKKPIEFQNSQSHRNNRSFQPYQAQSNQIQLQYVVQHFKQGSRYEGTKYQDMRHGQGKFFYQDGGMYDGNWKFNKMDGFGKLYYQSGKIAYEGEWKDDKFNGYGKLYNQEPDPLNESFGYENFDMIDQYWAYYEGQFFEDQKQGQGKMVFSNGEYFEGQFQKDIINGQGKFYGNSGKTISGVWENNQLVEQFQQ